MSNTFDTFVLASIFLLLPAASIQTRLTFHTVYRDCTACSYQNPPTVSKVFFFLGQNKGMNLGHCEL